MAFNVIQVPPASTGLKVDTAELTNGANTVERQVIVLGDPSTASSVAAVKAASVAAAATDPSLVVAISPNVFGQAAMASSLPVAIASNQSNLPANIAQVGGAAVALGQAAMASSLPVALASNQSNVPANIAQVGGAALALGQAAMAASVPVALASNQSNVPANIAQVGGAALALGSAAGASSVPVVLASDQAFSQGAAAGTAGSKSLVGGAIYNTTPPAPTNSQGLALQSDSAGALKVSIEGNRATYGASVVGFNVGTAATTDVFSIYGSGSKTIRVLRIGISSTEATAAAYKDVVASIRSTVNSAGAATTATDIPYDSNSAAGTAVVKAWTTAPTAGTTVGTIASGKLFLPITGTPASGGNQLIFDFANRGGQGVVLRGTGQGLVLTYNAVTPANAGSADAFVEWVEDNS